MSALVPHRHGARRRPAASPADSPSASRKRWVGLLTMATSAELGASAQRRVDFLHELRRASAYAWQQDGFSAVKLGEAFLSLGLGACECADDGRREAMLALLGACGTALDAIATARSTDLAQRTWLKGDE